MAIAVKNRDKYLCAGLTIAVVSPPILGSSAFSSCSSACTLCCDACDTIAFYIPQLIRCIRRLRTSSRSLCLDRCWELPFARVATLLGRAGRLFACFVLRTTTRGAVLKGKHKDEWESLLYHKAPNKCLPALSDSLPRDTSSFSDPERRLSIPATMEQQGNLLTPAAGVTPGMSRVDKARNLMQMNE